MGSSDSSCSEHSADHPKPCFLFDYYSPTVMIQPEGMKEQTAGPQPLPGSEVLKNLAPTVTAQLTPAPLPTPPSEVSTPAIPSTTKENPVSTTASTTVPATTVPATVSTSATPSTSSNHGVVPNGGAASPALPSTPSPAVPLATTPTANPATPQPVQSPPMTPGNLRKRPAAKSLVRRSPRTAPTAQARFETPTPVAHAAKPAMQSPKVTTPTVTKPKVTKPKVIKPTVTKAKVPISSRPAAPMVWEGPPDEDLPGGWPPGWTKRIYERKSGASKGHHDRYWYSPIHSYKLRSLVEVRRFLRALEETQGDEVQAKKIFKGIML